LASRALTVILKGEPAFAVVGAVTRNCVAGGATRKPYAVMFPMSGESSCVEVASWPSSANAYTM